MSHGNPFRTTQRREFLIGAVGGLCVVGAFVGFRWVTYADPPLPDEWLNEAEQEELADALTQFDAWVAGCLWEQRSHLEIEEMVDEPEGVKTKWSGEARSGRRMSFLTVEGVRASESVDEVSGPGHFCYVPAE